MTTRYARDKRRQFERILAGLPVPKAEPVKRGKNRTIPIAPRATDTDISAYWKPRTRQIALFEDAS